MALLLCGFWSFVVAIRCQVSLRQNSLPVRPGIALQRSKNRVERNYGRQKVLIARGSDGSGSMTTVLAKHGAIRRYTNSSAGRHQQHVRRCEVLTSVEQRHKQRTLISLRRRCRHFVLPCSVASQKQGNATGAPNHPAPGIAEVRPNFEGRLWWNCFRDDCARQGAGLAKSNDGSGPQSLALVTG
jgi:hypothetical protein